MLMLLSPAKSLDYETPASTTEASTPMFIQEATQLIEQLRSLSVAEVASLMDLSDKLAALNVTRYATWTPEHGTNNAKQALLAFNGDVYEGLNAASLSVAELNWAQQHLRILSGLYGVLRPLDYLQPYRLEMGTVLSNAEGKDLYAFWGEKITQALNESLQNLKEKTKVVVNCASDEYFKSVKPRLLEATIIQPVFEDWKGSWKIISFYAKRARGLMARFAIQHKISNPEKLKYFDCEGYVFDAEASTQNTWRFRRKNLTA
jgi:cytoplasmic iron level regulating protein YaaA (DUF328/UPF0246 family)